RRTFEAIYHTLLPLPEAGRSQFEDGAAPAHRGSTLAGRAIQIAFDIKNEGANGTVSIRAALEAIKHSLFPVAIFPATQLVNRSKVIRPVVVSGPVEIAFLVGNQPAIRKSGVRLTLEGVKDLF